MSAMKALTNVDLVDAADFLVAEWEMQEIAQQLIRQPRDVVHLSVEHRLDITY